MTSARRPTLSDRLIGADRYRSDMPALAGVVCTAVRAVVPFSFGCLATTDPLTGLINWAYKTAPLEIGDGDFAAAEYGDRDVNTFAEIATRAEPFGALWAETNGRPESCRRFRDYMAPTFGFTDELRVVMRSPGLIWGVLALYRGPGEPPFTLAEGRIVAAGHLRIADLIRQAVFSTDPGTPGAPIGPAVIVVDEADRVTNITSAAHARIQDLGGWDNGELPIVVLAAAETARRTTQLAMARAPGRSGTWLAVRATTFAPADPGGVIEASADVVITIDVATPADISTMTLAARGLSSREQDVVALVLQGAATKAIADTLHLSPHTVQDHLKSIFAKLGVNSRREMVSRLVGA